MDWASGRPHRIEENGCVGYALPFSRLPFQVTRATSAPFDWDFPPPQPDKAARIRRLVERIDRFNEALALDYAVPFRIRAEGTDPEEYKQESS
jgi:hypothetical protein